MYILSIDLHWNMMPLYLYSVLVLSLFTIVRFKNEACSTTTGGNGTCYSSSDCSSLGGSISGVCASGFGVCCLCKYFLALYLFTNMLFCNSTYPQKIDTKILNPKSFEFVFEKHKVDCFVHRKR